MTEIFGKQYYYPNTPLEKRISESISRFYSSTGIVPKEIRISDRDFPGDILTRVGIELEVSFLSDHEQYRIRIDVLPSSAMMPNYVWVLFPEKEKEKEK